MGFDGDFDPSGIEFPGITYSPNYESGSTWATLYSSEVSGALALGQGLYYVSNFLTRDIAGKTAGICVNEWDFNFVKARTVGGGVVGRPDGYTRNSFQPCDCSYHKCDREFQALGYTLDFKLLLDGEPPANGLGYVLAEIDGVSGGYNPNQVNPFFDSLGFPAAKKVSQRYDIQYGEQNAIKGIITKEKFNQYKSAFAAQKSVQLGNKESALLAYALADFCESATAGLEFKNNIISFLAFAQDVLNITVGNENYSDLDDGGDAWNAAASDIIYNYQRNADIPGFTAAFIYEDFTGVTGTQNLQEKCMCLDGGMHGYDAYPFADVGIVQDQLTAEDGIGGSEALQLLGFTGDERDLAEFLCLDGQFLKTLGITGAKDYKYGPNWAYGFGFSELNVVATNTPAFKNWEVRDSGKIRLSGTPNGEPYSFGRQWLEWGQRIGVPSYEYVPVNPITLGGGDFADPNFGYRGRLEGSLIYRGRMKSDVLPYEGQDYEFAFKGMTFKKEGTGNNILLGLTTIRHIDAVTNTEAYGVSGSIEDIVFSEGFSESPHDKTIYRL